MTSPAIPGGAANTVEPLSQSDFIVYVDESGDHGLQTMQPDYPIFVLAFCIFSKREYIDRVVPAMQDFKFKHFGHDMVVLHEREIRQAEASFKFLTEKGLRERFMEDLSGLVEAAAFTLIASVIRKDRIRGMAGGVLNPYHLALRFGLERIHKFLAQRGQGDRQTHVVFETRGKKEDDELELEFRRICDGSNYNAVRINLNAIFASKQVNSSGLQLADLVARPIGRHVLNPTQTNRAYDILATKFDRSPKGAVNGWGLKVYP